MGFFSSLAGKLAGKSTLRAIPFVECGKHWDSNDATSVSLAGKLTLRDIPLNGRVEPSEAAPN